MPNLLKKSWAVSNVFTILATSKFSLQRLMRSKVQFYSDFPCLEKLIIQLIEGRKQNFIENSMKQYFSGTKKVSGPTVTISELAYIEIHNPLDDFKEYVRLILMI